MNLDDAIRALLEGQAGVSSVDSLAAEISKTVRQHDALRRLQGATPEQIARDFLAWRDDVDCVRLLDTFDLALGYFSGRGCDTDTTLAWAEHLRREAIRELARKS